MNTGLTLRTAHITAGIAAVRAGATLLYDSIPDAEEKETHIKARALLETLAEAGRLAQARRPRARRPPQLPESRPGSAACGSCWWITRTRSCTPSATTSGSTGRR